MFRKRGNMTIESSLPPDNTSPAQGREPVPASRVADWMFLQPRILDQMHDAVIVTNLDGIVQCCNRAVSDIYGFTPEELAGQSVAVLYPEEDREHVLSAMLSVVHEKGEYRGELRNRTRAGQDIYIHLSVSVLRDEDGTPVGMVGFSIDVTAQKLGGLALQHANAMERERDAMEESAAHMQLLFSAVEKGEDVVLITEAEPIDSPGPRVVYVNRAFQRMTGYTADELIGRTPRVLQGPKTERAALDRIRKALKALTPVREQITNYRKDGTEFRVDLSIFPLANAEGWFTHWIAIQREITHEYMLQQELQRSEERYRILAESIPQFVWASDADGTKIFCNQRYLDYIGAGSLTQLDSSWLMSVHPDERDRVISTWQHAVATGEPYTCEYRMRRKDGVYRHFLARATASRNADGAVERWMGSTTDIHDQKLAETALRQTEKLAAAARLASSISHEINNPLAGAINSIYLVTLDPALSESSRAFLLQAEAELARVAHVTRQTLGFFRQSTAPVMVRLSELMDSALLLFERRLASHAVMVDRRYRTCPEFYCCSDELRQVFANLISNSLDAMPFSGRMLIHISEARLWNEARTPGIRVTLADTGHGVPSDLRDRIFDPFVSTKEATGTGLGLWVVKDLVQRRGGEVRLRSSTDPAHQGTVVTIFFPHANA